MMKEKAKAIGCLLLVVLAFIAVWFVGASITAWFVSILVSVLFTIDFGFWQAFAAVLLLGVFSNIAFSGLKRRSTQ